MADRIDGLTTARHAANGLQDKQAPLRASGGNADPAPARPPTTAPAAESVTLTDSARRLDELTALASDGDGMDRARVERIRLALAEGRYPIDPQQIAERLIAFDDLMGG